MEPAPSAVSASKKSNIVPSVARVHQNVCAQYVLGSGSHPTPHVLFP
jgi:hypothetical protein